MSDVASPPPTADGSAPAAEAAVEETFVFKIPGKNGKLLLEGIDSSAPNAAEAKDAFRRVMNNSDEYRAGDEAYEADCYCLSLHGGCRPFFIAALVGNNAYLKKTPVEALEQVRVDPVRKRTIVDFACRGNNVEALRFLRSVLSKETFFEKNTGGFAPGHVCAHAGSLDALKFLVEECKDDDISGGVNATAKDGESVLGMACRFGRPAMVEYLLTQKAQKVDVDLRSNIEHNERVIGHRTPWTTACLGADVDADRREDSVAVLKILFAHGAHKKSLQEAKECGGENKYVAVTPEQVLAVGGDDEKEPGRLFAKLKHFPILPSACFGDGPKLRSMVANAAAKQASAAATAAEKKHKHAAAAAAATNSGSGITAGTATPAAGAADADASAEHPATPTITEQNLDVSTSPISSHQHLFYLAAGVKRDRWNASLHQACRNSKNVEIVRFLCETAGFDIDKEIIAGPFTPLIEAIVENNDGAPEIVKYLLDKQRVDANKLSSKGMPPVYAAARAGKNEALAHLIDHGCNQNIVYSQASPFYAAVEQNQLACVETMLKTGRVDTSFTFYGRNCMQTARERKLAEMVALLEKYNVA
jgi:ankyrin repeat protein